MQYNYNADLHRLHVKGQVFQWDLLEYWYEHVIQKDESVSEEIIWSHGLSSEFKNKYKVHLLEQLLARFKKKFIWKFTAKSLGKGVVGGIRGNVKFLVRSTSMSESKPVIVQDATSFFEVTKKVMKKTEIHLIESKQVHVYKKCDIYDDCVYVTGISRMHIISVCKTSVELWQNAGYYHSSEPDIIIQTDGVPIATIKEDNKSELPIVIGDCVMVTKGLFKGYYAIVQGKSCMDEVKIQYFEERRCAPGDQCWVLNENDFGSQEKVDLRKVVALVDN